MAGPTSNYGPGTGWPVQMLDSVTLPTAASPPPPPPACSPGGGTSYSDAGDAGMFDTSEWNLASGDHWFRADTLFGGVKEFELSSGGSPFFAANTDATWRVWVGDGTSPPEDVTGECELSTVGTNSVVSGIPDGEVNYLVVTVPDGCRPMTLQYAEYAPA